LTVLLTRIRKNGFAGLVLGLVYELYFIYQNQMGIKTAKKVHPISELEARMNPAVLEKARKMAWEESCNIRLTLQHEEYGKHSDVRNSTKNAVSKLENRKNI